jgi:hypothetical protein
MPTLYMYFGIRVFFYGKEHEPIHVHGRHQGKESKAEIFTKHDKVVNIRFKDIAERPPLEGRQLKDFKALVVHEAENIIKTWNEYFEDKKHIEPQVITRRIK